VGTKKKDGRTGNGRTFYLIRFTHCQAGGAVLRGSFSSPRGELKGGKNEPLGLGSKRGERKVGKTLAGAGVKENQWVEKGKAKEKKKIPEQSSQHDRGESGSQRNKKDATSSDVADSCCPGEQILVGKEGLS